MRRLTIRFLAVDERRPPASRTWFRPVPDAEFLEICRWATRGGLLWGRDRKRVSINVIRLTAPPEDVAQR